MSNIPASKRDAIRTIVALKQLSDPQSRLTVPQRRQLVQKIAAGLEAAVPGINDPKTLSDQANALIEQGIKPDVNTLEYWGENSATQAAVRPVIDAALKLLDKAAASAKAAGGHAGEHDRRSGRPAGGEWEQLSTQALRQVHATHDRVLPRTVARPRQPAAQGRRR